MCHEPIADPKIPGRNERWVAAVGKGALSQPRLSFMFYSSSGSPVGYPSPYHGNTAGGTWSCAATPANAMRARP